MEVDVAPAVVAASAPAVHLEDDGGAALAAESEEDVLRLRGGCCPGTLSTCEGVLRLRGGGGTRLPWPRRGGGRAQ